jgi:hypothetical protein
MPNLTSLVLTDRAATPVNHTFAPQGINPQGVAALRESSGVPIGDNQVTVSQKQLSTGKWQSRLQFTFPIVQTQTINGVSAPTVVRTARAEVSFKFDSTSTLQERKNAVGMVASALASSQAMMDPVLTQLQTLY